MAGLRRVLSFRPRIGLALSGGGCKAFFGLGVGCVLQEAGIPIDELAGTSAGSAMALTLMSGSAEKVLRYFYAITLRNKSNFHFSRLFRGRRPFPHEGMYRRAITTYMDYEKLRKSRTRVSINALLLPPEKYPPEENWKRLQLYSRMVRAFREEIVQAKRGMFYPVLAKAAIEAELEEVVFHNEDFTSPQRAEDIILASSSVPPLVSFQRIDGNYYLDGGILNNLPILHLEKSDLIVAVYYEKLTRLHAELTGIEEGRTIIYVHPDENLPITTWDYANPNGILQAYEMGRRAGEKTLKVLYNIMR